MTDSEIIEVVTAHKEGKQIQMRSITANDCDPWDDVDKPGWAFEFMVYRVKPEPRKPREWWAEIPIDGSVGQIFTDSRQLTKGGELVHVREVIEE